MMRFTRLFSAVILLAVLILACSRADLDVNGPSVLPPDDLDENVVELETYLEVKYLPELQTVILNGNEDAPRFKWCVFPGNSRDGWSTVRVEYITSDNAGFKIGGLDPWYGWFLLQTKDGKWLNTRDTKIVITNVELAVQPWGDGTDLWFHVNRAQEPGEPSVPGPGERPIARLRLKDSRLIPNKDWVGKVYPRAMFWAEPEDNLALAYSNFDGDGYPLPLSHTRDYSKLTVFNANNSENREDWDFAILGGDAPEFEPSDTVAIREDGGAFIIKFPK